MESLRELYRIGPGPSSSHTIGVQNACLYYLQQYPNYENYKVRLTGSLALTGKGHMSDAIAKSVFGERNVEIEFNYLIQGKHPNTLIFSCIDDGNEVNTLYIYSVGGGAIQVEGIKELVDPMVYPQTSLEEIMNYCKENNCSIVDYVNHYEPDVHEYLLTVARKMLASVDEGLQKEGILPGPLQLKKIAKDMFESCKKVDDPVIKEKLLVSSYVYAAMEQNASDFRSIEDFCNFLWCCCAVEIECSCAVFFFTAEIEWKNICVVVLVDKSESDNLAS